MKWKHLHSTRADQKGLGRGCGRGAPAKPAQSTHSCLTAIFFYTGSTFKHKGMTKVDNNSSYYYYYHYLQSLNNYLGTSKTSDTHS
jgi:hypothetical protein